MQSLYLNHNEFTHDCKPSVKRRKQNHKISFHFFSGSPHTPPRKWIGKEIFGFGSRLRGARGAHCSLHHRVRAYDLGFKSLRTRRVRSQSLRDWKKVRISSYRRSHSEQDAESRSPTATGSGKSARIFQGFCHEIRSARSRKSGFHVL